MFDDPIVQKPKHKPPHKIPYANPYEALLGFRDDLGTGTKQQTKDIFNEVRKQLFGGDLKPGQELNLNAHQKKKDTQPDIQSLEKKANHIRPAIDYIGEILRAGEKKPQDEQKLQQEIQNLIVELKGLASATKQLEKEIFEVTGHTIVNPGTYHKTFFRWLISIVQDARVKIDNAGMWLATMNGKQSKKGMSGGGKKKQTNYWNMAKKHGTKFTLSGERGVATQSG